MRRYASLWFIVAMVITGLAGAAMAQRPPEGQLSLSLNFTMAPTSLDPAEARQVIASAVFLYALHDALIKPLPGNPMAPALATSWTESPDGLVYEFTLRQGVTFHNGDPFTAEDVKFSFLRYKGASAKQLHEKVKAIEILDAHRLRFVLHTPWPDFLTVYAGLASGAGWVVPKAYVERVGDEGFQEHPIGLGPYGFVRMDPGVVLVLEAYDRYWRKPPTIQRLLLKSVPDPTTRLAMLKTGELDLATLSGSTARQAPSSPVRSSLPCRWSHFHDPVQAKRLLIEAGYPNGFDAGDLTPFPPTLRIAEAVGSYLGAVGIRTQVRSLELPAFFAAWREKKLKGLVLADSAILGNAANRFELYVLGTGLYAYGSAPDLDALFQQQAVERDRTTREALLHRIQSLMHERVMHAPLLEQAALHGVGARVEEPAVGLIPLAPFAAPYEEMRLKRP